MQLLKAASRTNILNIPALKNIKIKNRGRARHAESQSQRIKTEHGCAVSKRKNRLVCISNSSIQYEIGYVNTISCIFCSVFVSKFVIYLCVKFS